MEESASSPTPLSIHIKITVHPENSETYLAALRPLFEEATAEPLNIFCEVYRDDKNPGVFRIVENWNCSLDHMMNVQMKKDYYNPYYEATESLFIKPQVIEIFSRMPGTDWVRVKKEFYPGRS
ncbi:hypothetical protein VTI28DRAFT_6135 [Corynascus sepedonium]